MTKLQYENALMVNRTLYVRTYNPDTNSSSLDAVDYIPRLWINGDGDKKSFINQSQLKEIPFKTEKEYKDTIKLYEDTDVRLYGHDSKPFGYIRENFPNPTDSDHDFHTWYFDIETMVPEGAHKDSWKPNSGEHACKAIITSIQIYDTKFKEFYIFGLEKQWENLTNYESELGKINYWAISSEENLLKAFIKLLNKRFPTMLCGWNSEGYDIPYLTGRIARVLDGVEDLYVENYDEKKRQAVMEFNPHALKGGYVKQLSPLGSVRHRTQETSFGMQDFFEWDGIFLEDYKNLYQKYTYTSLTSYSLESVCTHELGAGKVAHDEHANFGDFYRQDFDKFILYGVRDVELLQLLDNKLKLIDLAKYLAYMCGVTINDVRGTLKQWHSYIFNEAIKQGLVLPLTNKFDQNDTVYIKKAIEALNNGSLTLPEERKNRLLRVYSDPSLHGQKFIGGWTYASTAYHKWVFSLDFASLYPSAIRWGNIGADTLIEPKNLHPELVALRAKYFNYYEKDWETPEVSAETARFISEVLRKPEVVEEIREVLVRHNVCATPNGMFFTKERLSITAEIIQDLQSQRKKYKKEMKKYEQEMEDIKAGKSDKEYEYMSALRDKFEVYQMGVKIFLNSYYGSVSLPMNPTAGQSEFFSVAITSTSQVANMFNAQNQSQRVAELSKTIQNDPLTYIAQCDTDSSYIIFDEVLKAKFGQDYEKVKTTEELVNAGKAYIEKIAQPLVKKSMDLYAYAMNAYEPDILTMDAEVICDNFISIAPKMYFARKYWDEGVTLAKPKLKVTGLSMIRSTTPKYFRETLKPSMDILITGDIQKAMDYFDEVQEGMKNVEPKQLAINVGVTSLDYEYNPDLGKYLKFKPDSKGKDSLNGVKGKYLSAPMNSRASIKHNEYIRKVGLDVKEIEPGDKISYLSLKMPNPAGSDVLAFQNPKVFDGELKDYIDYSEMFDKAFMSPIKLICDPLKWELVRADTQIDEDEW